MTKPLARIRDSSHRRGSIGAIVEAGRIAFNRFYNPIKWERQRRIRQAIDDRFDREHGVDTTGEILPEQVDVRGPNAGSSVGYAGTYPDQFTYVMKQLPVDFDRSIFVDFGSGKGRALLLASEFPFRRIVGIEFSGTLHRVAQENCLKYRSPRQRCRAFELLCLDAVEYPIPPEPAVFFFYNPFNEEVTRRVADKIRRSLQETPREAFVVYFGPAQLHVWDEMEILRKIAVDGPVWPGYGRQRTAVWRTRSSR